MPVTDPVTGEPIASGGKLTSQGDLQRQLNELQAKEAKRLANAKLGLDERGLPIRPEFKSILDKETGQLQEGFRIGKFDDVNLDSRALDRLRELAFAEGPSQAAQTQLDFQAAQQAAAVDDLAKQQAGQQASAFDALARQGGLGGGSRERLARQAQRQGLFGRQDISRQGNLQRLGIIGEDEARKIGLLDQVQQGDLAAGQFGQQNRAFEANRRQFDIQNALNELQNTRDADLRAFEARSKAVAAQKSADAQARASSGCFAGDTMIQMADSTFKQIKDIDLDDSIMVGGKVYNVSKYRVHPGDKVYNYGGVIVTGSHAVLEDGVWMRVRDSKKALITLKEIDVVYNLSNENHLIPVYGVLFADFEETDNFSVSDKESLNQMNNNLKTKGPIESVSIL